MKRMIFIATLVGLFPILLFANERLLKDMVHFDQSYIPALAFTSQNKIEPSRKAIKHLQIVWKSFKEKYYSANIKDSDWQKDMDEIDHTIIKSELIIQQGTDLLKAHENLEKIRIIFLKMRERNHIDYFIDYLTKFHEPMETVVLSVKGKTPATLTNKEIKSIANELPTLERRWQNVRSASFDLKLFEFEKKAASMNIFIKKESDAIDNLKKSLASKNREKIIRAGIGVKPNFAKLFMLFGNFEQTSGMQ